MGTVVTWMRCTRWRHGTDPRPSGSGTPAGSAASRLASRGIATTADTAASRFVRTTPARAMPYHAWA
eukprot:32307-Eustigmatos_ZCMA.PRE.1